MKITMARLRKEEESFIQGYGEVTEGRLFDFKYLKGDILGIIIDGNVYEETSTAFDFVSVKLPGHKELYLRVEALVNNVISYKDYATDISRLADLVTEIERAEYK